MTITVNIHEAKTHLSRLLARVLDGEDVVIAKAGTPVARIVPVLARPSRRVPGSAAGLIEIMPGFDAPLPDELLDAFES
jgi:prevent-host-death family protein